MVSTLRFTGLAAIAMLLAIGPAVAHHAWPVDRSKRVTVKGTVTSYDWSDPHVMIGLDVETADGRREKWNVGGPSMNRMAGNGWGRATLKGGEVISAVGWRFSDGSNLLQLEKIVLADGKEMLLYGRR